LHVEAGQVLKLTPMGGATASSTVVEPAGGTDAPTGNSTVIFISAMALDT
jgi:hypothetical protein